MSLGDRLRELAERLPPGASLSLTREGLLELATGEEDEPDQPQAQGDFTIAEVAARFHRSASTIRGWCEHGRFEGAYKLNDRDWRISQAAVDAFLALQRDGQRTEASLGSWRRLRARTVR